MKILIVGAGAVGQVYGYQLQQSGHHITYYAKNMDSKVRERGFNLYALNRSVSKPIQFKDFALAHRIEELGKSQFDFVFLCFPSTGLYDEDFPKLAATFGDALVVVLQPGLRDQAQARKYIPEASFVPGVITFIAFQAPLAGSTDQSLPGVAYWFPPGGKLAFSGQKMMAERVMRLFKNSEISGKWAENTTKDGAIPGAILTCFVKAVENEGWDINRFLSSPQISKTQAAMGEAIAIVCRHYGISMPFFRHFLGPFLFRLIIGFARMVMPFNLDVYLKFHYQKVSAQSDLDFQAYLDLAKEYQLPVTNLLTLRGSH